MCATRYNQGNKTMVSLWRNEAARVFEQTCVERRQAKKLVDVTDQVFGKGHSESLGKPVFVTLRMMFTMKMVFSWRKPTGLRKRSKLVL